MPISEQGTVIKVPFPYTDRPTRQSRPALVVSHAKGFQASQGLLWVLMITSAENRSWTGDVPIDDLAMAGLPAPSVIRPAKIATIEAADATQLGEVSPAVFRLVLVRLRKNLGLA